MPVIVQRDTCTTAEVATAIPPPTELAILPLSELSEMLRLALSAARIAPPEAFDQQPLKVDPVTELVVDTDDEDMAPPPAVEWHPSNLLALTCRLVATTSPEP